MDNIIFKNERYETFTYEILELSSGIYKLKSDITKYVKNASIRLDFNRDIIGNASFELNDAADIDYLKDRIKITYNISGSDLSYNIPMGVWMLNSQQREVDGKTTHRKVKGFDQLQALDQDKVDTAVSYPAGTNIVSAVETLLDGVGTWVIHQIEPSTVTLNEDMTYEQGRSKLFIINGLLNAINYYPLWCTGNGVFKSVPWTSTQTITWEFLDNNEGLYDPKLSEYIDYASIYNKVNIITAETEPDTDPITSVKTFEDYGLDEHPFSYTNLGRYIVKVFRSEAASQSYADLRAKREIYKMLEINEIIDKSHAFVTSRENDGLPYQGDCYRFKNTLLDVNNIYKIYNMSWNLKAGSLVNSKIRRFAEVG